MANNVQKCIVCGVRPRMNVGPYCQQCKSQIDAERNRRKAPQAFLYLTYKGFTVGLFPKGDGTFSGHLMTTNGIPKSKIIDLNVYQNGYTREQIKRLKAGVLAIANVRVKRVKVNEPEPKPKAKAKAKAR